MAAAVGAMWAPAALRLLRAAASKTVAVARNKLGVAARPFTAAASRASAPSAAISFARRPPKPVDDMFRRFFSSITSPATLATGRVTTQRTSIAQETLARFRQSAGRVPLASTLRPSLTGGAIPRSAGGYGLGLGLGVGGARYFSHSPASAAEVVSNVSQAMRAFMLGGKRAKYDGITPRGERRCRAVSSLEEEAPRKAAAAPRFAPGAYVDYRLSPTVTALSPLLVATFPYPSSTPSVQNKAAPAATLNQDGLLEFLSGDFERAARDLATILADLKRLACLGDLPITLEGPSLLRVRFPGVDADTVERLCEDAGVHRGYIGEDLGFNASVGLDMALKFPFAPDGDPNAQISLPSPGGSLRSMSGHELFDEYGGGFADDAYLDEFELNPGLSDPETRDSAVNSADDGLEGMDGIYRFLGECGRAEGRY